MLVGILKPHRGTCVPMLSVYKKILKHNSIEYIDLDINDLDFWDKVKTVDLFLAKFSQTDDDLALAAQIVPVISKFMKINSFPNYETVWHYDDKVKQYYLLKQFNFPVIESYVFWDRDAAIKWARSCSYPKVFKLKGGAGSVNVKLIKTRASALAIINSAFASGIDPHYFDILGKLKALNYSFVRYSKYLLKPFYRKYIQGVTGFVNYSKHRNYVYFQDYLPGNHHDTRVTILGERAFAFKRFVRKNDFRASGSNHYDMNRDHIDMKMVEIGFEISKRFGFQSMAYDFVYDTLGNPALIEMSYTYGDYPEFSTGYWDTELVWHDGCFVPEYLELVDALQMPELMQPEIDLDSPYKHAKIE